MFSGVNSISLDNKNRITIPTKYRDLLLNSNSRVVITIESPKYLIIYPEDSWLVVKDKILNLTTSSHPLVKSYQRLVLGYETTIELDKVGRVLISNMLKELVNLDKDLVLVGLGNRFELWNKSTWDIETKEALNVSQTQLAELLNGFSL
jgi:MraZ protein